MDRAHPRSRGENTPEDRARLRIQGSSPLTRGKRSEDRQGEACRGLIPAHAGKTSTWLFVSLVTWAHPRSRGENQSKHTRSPACAGSSPLTRGKLGVGHCAIDCHGLIPAHAGKTNRVPCKPGDAGLIPAHAGKTTGQTAVRGGDWAHPRSRGENWFVRHPGCVASGSSPLTRGKQRTTPAPITVDGLIPAHAGKTKGIRVSPGACRAHPRSRGENATAPGTGSVRAGSSPLTRGKRRAPRGRESTRRLIPAHAGKTCGAPTPGGRGGAHPRSRGENSLSERIWSYTDGSSPLTRGKHRDPVKIGVGGRLIPAHAGKTRTPACSTSRKRAHPRSRGENSDGHGSVPTLWGSSPLTRGKRLGTFQ